MSSEISKEQQSPSKLDTSPRSVHSADGTSRPGTGTVPSIGGDANPREDVSVSSEQKLPARGQLGNPDEKKELTEAAAMPTKCEKEIIDGVLIVYEAYMAKKQTLQALQTSLAVREASERVNKSNAEKLNSYYAKLKTANKRAPGFLGCGQVRIDRSEIRLETSIDAKSKAKHNEVQ